MFEQKKMQLYMMFRDFFEANKDYVVSDKLDKSFVIKSLLFGYEHTVFMQGNKIIKGGEILFIVNEFRENKFSLEGKLVEHVNGKFYKDLPSCYRGRIEEGCVNLVCFDRDISQDEINYFLEKL